MIDFFKDSIGQDLSALEAYLMFGAAAIGIVCVLCIFFACMCKFCLSSNKTAPIIHYNEMKNQGREMISYPADGSSSARPLFHQTSPGDSEKAS